MDLEDSLEKGSDKEGSEKEQEDFHSDQDCQSEVKNKENIDSNGSSKKGAFYAST